MFRRFGDWFRNYMLGRYGTDQLNRALLIFGLVLMLPGILVGRRIPWLSWLGLFSYVPLILCIFRINSRNIAARQRENARYLNMRSRLQDKEHRYFRCPKCRQTVRVPSRRGKLKIRCPKCGEQFIKRT